MHRPVASSGYRKYAGTSLIEVLVAMLLLSVGMLSLAAMVSYAVQMPKLAGYRAAAVNLAAEEIARMRANPSGFSDGASITRPTAAEPREFSSSLNLLARGCCDRYVPSIFGNRDTRR